MSQAHTLSLAENRGSWADAVERALPKIVVAPGFVACVVFFYGFII